MGDWDRTLGQDLRRRMAGLPEEPRAEQPPIHEPRAYRQMTPDEIRADELVNVLSFIDVDPPAPTIGELRRSIQSRIGELTPETLQAPQPDNDPAARISGAIAVEARELSPPARIEFLTEIVATTARLVEETPPLYPDTEPVSIREALEACAFQPCIRVFWGARRRCAEYSDGRELCPTCKARAALA